MAYAFVPIERLLPAVKEAIRTEIAQYYKDESLTIDNMHLHTRELQSNDPRQTQIEFLLDMIKLVQMLPDSQTSDKHNQSLVLSAAVLFVTNEIAASYSWSTPWSSHTYRYLQNALGIEAATTDANKPNISDKIRMLRIFDAALRTALYVEGDPLNTLLGTTKIQTLISHSKLTKTATPFFVLIQVGSDLQELTKQVISNPRQAEPLAASLARLGVLSQSVKQADSSDATAAVLQGFQ